MKPPITEDQKRVAIARGDLRAFDRVRAGCSDCGLSKILNDLGITISGELHVAC